MYVDGEEDAVLFLFVRAVDFLALNARSTSIQLTRNPLPIPTVKSAGLLQIPLIGPPGGLRHEGNEGITVLLETGAQRRWILRPLLSRSSETCRCSWARSSGCTLEEQKSF